ncbi:MAG: rhodanese-like domain-containing protein [Candidatus Latescibacteria bacterium]|jgi:rhodanese-related sulfurtransferase|nr:rhodanese-like domain-containing protein [Candidatus Latescibacterota bacterium]
MSVLHDLAAADLQHELDGGVVILIDVREPSEHAAECIPQARPVPLSAFAADELPESNGKRLVLYCRSGLATLLARMPWNRSA